ncbi:MAG: glycosyltransferase family 2 protein [Planctomycetaceae bacterium]
MSQRILTALPVFNEKSHVQSVLDEVRQYANEILVVDDGSSDGTPEILAQQADIRTVVHSQNQGYGAALVSAFDYAVREGFDVLVTIDCDGQHQPQMIPELAARIVNDDQIDMASGSRYLKAFDGQSLPPEDRRAINMQITKWLNDRFQLGLTDAFCGFKAYRVPSLPDLKITDMGYAMPLELWVEAVAADWKIVEHAVPLVYLEEERSFGGALDDSQKRMAYYEQVLANAVAAVGRPIGSA